MEHPLALVVAGVAFDSELYEQCAEAVVAASPPLPAQIHHTAVARGVADHSTTNMVLGLKHHNALAFGLQSPCGNQAGEPCTGDDRVEVGVRIVIP